MNFQSQDYLAKLLAKENLEVQHGNYSTASFDLESRTIKLPLWRDKGKDVYDLLVGHEVGHALYTPLQGFHDAQDEISNIPKSFLNIVEDIRIEKKVQRTYPGIVGSFKSGYKKLFNDGLFGKIEDLEKYNFMDRLNIHAKGRGLFPVQFSDTEQLFVNKALEVETWEDVINVCQEIVDFLKHREDYEEEEEKQQTVPQYGKGDGEEDPTSSSEMMDGQVEREMQSETDDAFRKNQDDLLDQDENGTQAKYSSGISDPMIKKMIIPYERLRESRKQFPNRYESTYTQELFNQDKTEIDRTASMMAKDFERKKAAFEYSRSREAKTGSLNVNKLHQYKYSEDIFQTVTTLANAKSHGIIMFMDLSGSMNGILRDVIKQTVTVAMFCKKVNIPFDVYSFTSNRHIWDDPSETGDNYIALTNAVNITNILSSTLSKAMLMEAYKHLYAISVYDQPGAGYSDRSEFDKLGYTPLTETAIAAEKLVRDFQENYRIEKTNVIFLTDGIADSIRENYDPDANMPTSPDWYSKRYLKVGKKTISYTGSNEAYPAVLKHISKETGAKTIGFFLYSGAGDIKSAFIGVDYAPNRTRKDYLNQLKREGVLHFPKTAGYDDYFVIKVNPDDAQQQESFMDQDIKDAKSIKRKFKSFNSGRKKSRQIVNKITDAVAA